MRRTRVDATSHSNGCAESRSAISRATPLDAWSQPSFPMAHSVPLGDLHANRSAKPIPPPGIPATEFSSGGWSAMDDWPTSVNDTNGARSSSKLSGGYPASQETRTGFHCRPPAWKRHHGTTPENGLTTPGVWLVAPLHRRLYHLLERSDVVRKFSTVSVTSMIGDGSSLEGAIPGNKTGHGQQSAADLRGAAPGFDSFRRVPFIGVLGENSAQQDSNRETHHVLTT
jgi:hypothetical protein